MESLRIDKGITRLLIEDGPETIEFNATDVAWASHFQNERAGVMAKLNDFTARAGELDNKGKADGLSDQEQKELGDQVNKLRMELCTYMREKIDLLFGEGTSQKVFGNLNSEWALLSFFDGVVPYVTAKRTTKMAQYLPPQVNKKNRKRTRS